MTPYQLLEQLQEVMGQVLDGVLLGRGGKIKVYAQNSPMQTTEGGESEVFPYCLIRLGDGKEDAIGPVQEVALVFASYDQDAGDYEGYRDVINMVEAARQYFCKFPVIGPFEAQRNMEWVFPENDEYYPAFFGALVLHIALPRLQIVSENT